MNQKIEDKEEDEDVRIINADIHSSIVRALFVKEYSISPPNF
jgi:hypothetical protein